MNAMSVLVSLHKGYGLGDAVQMSAVLRHVAKYRPHWKVDFQAEEGRQCVGRGLCANTFAFGTTQPTWYYDAEVQVLLFDTWANWQDRPNTRVSSCLHERFGLDWDPACGRYSVEVDSESSAGAATLLRYKEVVALHYQGDSSAEQKDLTESQAGRICRAIIHQKYEPVVLDWRKRSGLPRSYRRVDSPQHWGGDAEMVCAVIGQCRAFVGIDSGPSKCASATDTPALVVWTGHHPAPFHDPAPNTTHLVPAGYHGLSPVCGDPGVIRWFEANHDVRTYVRDPVPEVERWLEEVL